MHISVQLPTGLFPSPSLKKKREKKIHHPTQDSPPTRTGKMGYSTLGSGKNREQKKRLVWSSASWSGSPWPPLLPSTARSLYSPAVPRCFSAASSHQPRLRWAQGGMGRKEEGTGSRCQRPPPLEVGRADAWCCLFALLLDRPCHLTDCPSPALLPLTCVSFGEQRLQLHAPRHLESVWLCGCVGDGGRVIGHKILPYPRQGEEVQKCVILKCQVLPALTITRPSLPEFPWRADPMANCLCLCGSLQGVLTPRWTQAPFLVLEGQGGRGRGGGGGIGRGVEGEKVEGYLHLA